MQKQKQKSVAKKRGLYIALALALFVGAPVLGAILVQNFTQWDVVVETPPIDKVAGADVAASDYLTVNLGGTITNDDSSVDGGTDTLLSHEEISFTCFAGDRTYYTDVIQLDNTAAEDWDVTLTIEDDLNGGAALGSAIETDFTLGDADIWLVATDTDSSTSISELPNPANLAGTTNWGADYIQLEVVAGTMSELDGTISVGTIPTGENRQLGLVVDCGSNMVNGEVGMFRLTVAASPN